MKRRRPEQELQSAVFRHLDARATKNVFAFHPANGGWRSPVEAKIFKGLGVRAGVCDVIAIANGANGVRVFGLELKAPGSRLSLVQRSTIDQMKAAGVVVAVASDLDSALDHLEAAAKRAGFVRVRVEIDREGKIAIVAGGNGEGVGETEANEWDAVHDGKHSA